MLLDNLINEHILPHIGGFLSALITGISGYIFGYKKRKFELRALHAENTGKEIENAVKIIDLYKEAINDLNARYENKFKETVQVYEQKAKLLEDEINFHKKIINQLKGENAALRKKIKEYSME